MELHFLNASENNVMPSLTSTSTVNNNTRHEVCPITMPLTSASDIKSWTARSPTASAPHSHALNRLLCGLHRSDRLSQRLYPPTRLEPQHGVHEPAHRTRAACTECSAPAACIRGCRHWRNYALPPASWRPPLTRGTSTPAASSPTVWRSMRPVRGERQGDDAHAVFDVTSPARSVWSL